MVPRSSSGWSVCTASRRNDVVVCHRPALAVNSPWSPHPNRNRSCVCCQRPSSVIATTDYCPCLMDPNRLPTMYSRRFSSSPMRILELNSLPKLWTYYLGDTLHLAISPAIEIEVGICCQRKISIIGMVAQTWSNSLGASSMYFGVMP